MAVAVVLVEDLTVLEGEVLMHMIWYDYYKT
jgi:hypothetical protein